MSAPTCRCGKPVNGTTLCDGCKLTLEVALGNIPAYYDDTDTLRNRQTRYGGTASKGSIGKTQPLGMDPRFTPGGQGTRVVDATRNAVTTWARVILEERNVTPPRYDTVRSVCAFLLTNLGIIAVSDWGDECKADMLAVERQLRALVDRPAEGWYAGICGSVTPYDDGTEVMCERPLYAEPGSAFVRCRICGCTYDVAARRASLLREAEDRQATVDTIARIVTTLGDVKVSRERIAARVRQWVQRGHLTSHGVRMVDGHERPLYRVGDVLDRLHRDETDKAV